MEVQNRLQWRAQYNNSFHFRNVLTRGGLLALVVILVSLGCIVFAVTSFLQKKSLTADSKPTKLTYANPDLTSDDYLPPAIAPITMSSDRLLLPMGDTLYMLDSNNRVVWRYSYEPNIIRDVMVDPRCDIYVTASEALILVLDPAGKEIWRPTHGA